MHSPSLEVLDNDLAFTEWTGLTILDADVQAYAPQMQRFAGNTYRTDTSVPFEWEDGLSISEPGKATDTTWMV